MTLQTTPLDLGGATDADYRALNSFTNRLRAERLPGDPPHSVAEDKNRWQNVPPFVKVSDWVIWDPERKEIIGHGHFAYFDVEENKHLARAKIAVLPTYRQQGLATKLLAELAQAARQTGRRLLLFSTHSNAPAGDAFMERIGASKGLETVLNQLDLEAIDRDLLRRWQQPPGGRFELGLWDGPYPEADLEAIAHLNQVMNSAPTDDLDIEAFQFTPDHLRQSEKGLFANGAERWTLYAREQDSGAFAGYTQVIWKPAEPTYLDQGDTGVFPQYRGLGLGRWLKAAMLEKVLRDRPQVRHVRTNNANSNVPMLKINRELGFRPHLSEAFWQAPLDQVEVYLAQA